MRSLPACLLFVLAASQPTLHAATRTAARPLTPSAIPAHHSYPPMHRLVFAHFDRSAQDLPGEPVPSSVNPASRSQALSLTTFAVHSMLGFFGHSPR